MSDTTGTETITGPTAGVTVNAEGNSRVFQVDANVTASISGMTITGGSANSAAGLFNLGTLTLTGSTVTGNFAGNYGGGIVNYGTATLTSSTVSSNKTSGNDGGVFNGGTLTLTGSTVSG